jgi:hypothetical protein
MLDPVAALTRGSRIANRQRQQGLPLADTQFLSYGPHRHGQPQNFPQRTFIAEIHALQVVEQRTAFIVVEFVQAYQRRANFIADSVDLPLQIFDRINLRHAGYENAGRVDVELFEIRYLDILIFRCDARTKPVIAFLHCRAEIPVGESVIGFFAEKISTDHAARIHEVDLEIGGVARKA